MTTDRINQVSHHFERIIIYPHLEAIGKKSEDLLRADRPQSQENVQLETMFHNSNNFHTVLFAVCPMQCAKFRRELAPHQGKKCGNSKLNLKKSTVPPTKLRVRPA